MNQLISAHFYQQLQICSRESNDLKDIDKKLRQILEIQINKKKERLEKLHQYYTLLA